MIELDSFSSISSYKTMTNGKQILKENEKETTLFEYVLSWAAIILSAAGLIILFVFLWLLSHEYRIGGSDKILLEQTAQVGDFIGGLVGAIWAFAGVILFFAALRIQSKEFKAQRKQLGLQKEELEKTREEFKLQNNTMRLQRFENTFFSLLSLHHQIVNDIDMVIESPKKKGGASLRVTLHDIEIVQELIKGRDVFHKRFIELKKEFEIRSSSSIHEPSSVTYLSFWETVQTDFGHYFRNLYRIIKLVDQTAFIANSEQSDNQDTLEKENLKEQYKYTSIVRAQLSDFELLWLFYNCLSPNGEKKFKPLVEKYGMLKNMPLNLIHDNKLRNSYERSAFSNPLET